MRKYQKGYSLTGRLIVFVWITAIIGWVVNIIKLVHMEMPVDFGHVSILFILRIVGIFVAPLGSVLGLFF